MTGWHWLLLAVAIIIVDLLVAILVGRTLKRLGRHYPPPKNPPVGRHRTAPRLVNRSGESAAADRTAEGARRHALEDRL